MTGDIVETQPGVEAMASSGANHISPVGEDEGGRTKVESPNHHTQLLMNGLTGGAGSENRTPKPEILSVEGENSSRSDQGSIRSSSRGDEGANQGVKRGSRRKSETEGGIGDMETPQRLRLDRSAKSRADFSTKADSSTKPTEEENNGNEGGVVESSMFKQVKFENGAAITQSGLTDADDQGKALDALAAVMEVYGIPKEVVGLAADFPGEIGVGSKKRCRICKKPETAKHTIICDKCQHNHHLSCVKLKRKQAVDIENEHWQCESCGPEVGWQYWPLGRITPQHDRKLADSKGDEPMLHVNTIEHHAVTLPDTDAAVEDDSMRTHLVTTPVTSKGDDHGGPGILGNLNDQEVVYFPKENVTPVKRGRGLPNRGRGLPNSGRGLPNSGRGQSKRGRGRPRKDSTVLEEQIITNAPADLGVRDRALSEEQPALILGNNISASQPLALTPAMSPQIPLVGVTDILTTTNDTEIQGDTAIVTLSDDGFPSEEKQTKDPEVMLEDLRCFIASIDGRLEKGWEVTTKKRPGNSRVRDKIFISPDGHKFRSRLAVARFLGIPGYQKEPRTNVQPAAQRLETPTQCADLSLEGLRSRREMPLDMRLAEPQEEREKRIEPQKEREKPIEEKILVVKESRSLPPAGELLARRLPVELVGDALQVWEFLCRFSDFLDLKSTLTYEELETGLVNLGPPTTEAIISNVEVQTSSNPMSKENLGKVCAEAGYDSPHKPAGHSRDLCVEGRGVSLESAPNSVVQGEDSKAAGPGFNRIGMTANGLEQDMSVSVEAGGLPQSTTVQENRDLTPGPTESPGEEVSAMERAVASPDGTLNENFVMISRTHITLLKLLLSDLQFRINGSSNVSKSEEPKKKGRKPLHEVPQDIDVPEFSSDLPVNEVTWPELVRRYLITLIEAEKYGNLTELKLEERKWLLRCLQGDGGVPCGVLYTVVGVESDAQVLAEAEKELAVRLPKVGEMKEEEDDPVDGSDKLPEWVEALRPVAKMATNVGSRIRIKVKEALELGPPQWAREQLEWSISKDVFKGNASGPTKKAVVEVLNHYDVSPPCESPSHKTKPRRTVPSVDQLMQRCRVVLRTVADADKTDTFSILIGGPEGHGSGRLRGMVARPLDFRTIDARLAAGAYGGSVDAFAEDMRQIWRNVELLQKGGEVMELASKLSQLFEDLLQKQVINFMSGVLEVKHNEPKIDVVHVLEEGTEATNAPLTRSHLATAEKPEDKLQKAPWQDNDTCRVCGVDEDYESIMLCDKCDAEYHTYCLNPPLENVPEGNWFCPECVALDKGFPDRPSGKDVGLVEPDSLEGEDEQFPADRNMDDTVQVKELKEVQGESAAQCLLKQIESKEYWQLGLSERVHILKFLCNEAVETTQVHAHLEKSLDLAFDLQQQLSSLHAQRQDAIVSIEDQGRQTEETFEGLKKLTHTVKGTEASSVDTSSRRLRNHSSGVLGAEDIRVALPRILNFDADGKEDEHSAERINTTKGVSDSVKEGNHDVVTVNDAIHEDHKSDEETKTARASNCAILSNETVNEVPASADLDTPLAVFDSADMSKKRRNDDIEVHEGEFVTEVGRREANTPERIMIRNSKRAKFEELSEAGEPQVDGTKVTSTSKQTENLGCGNLLFASELREGQTVAPGSESKMDGVIDLEVQVKEVVGSESPAGGRNICVDESAELGRRVTIRSSRLSSERPDSSGASVMVGIAGAGLPPRTPKRKLETTLSSETLKKSRTDVTFNGEGIEGKDPLKMLKDSFMEESQSIVGTAQGIPALGEVIDDPHRGEALSDPKRQGPLQSPAMRYTPIMDSNALKLDAEIAKLELKLYNTTLRRDRLGTDDVGRDYWALSGPNQLPMLVVSECDVIGRAEFEGTEERYFSYVEQSERGNSDGEILQSDHTVDRSKETKTRWWAYNNEASIDSLVAWLNPRVKVERALKTSICHWRKTVLTNFHGSPYESNQEIVNTSSLGNGSDGSLKKERDTVQTSKVAPKRFPILKATSILQMRYGSSSFSDRVMNKKSTMPMEGRVIRCSCLEPLWKFKWHCQACHETYESLAELESHKNICPEGAATHSSGKKKQKGSGQGKNNLTPETRKKTATSEKGKKTGTSDKGKKKSKAATPKEGTRRLLEREDIGVHTSEENSWMSDDSTDPSTLHRPATRSKRQATSHLLNSDVNGYLAVSEEPVDDAFFLSDFQDDVHNPGMDDIEPEDFRMGFGSFSSHLQDDEWEANLRPERSELKRKKHGSGKKSSKQPSTQGTSEMALANFDYASLPMTFSTPDSTRDRILQIGCIADQGPTFAPALHFAPAFDPSLMIQPCYPDPNESPTDAVDFPGSSPLPSSQNGSPIGEFNGKDFVEGGLDAVSWYDPQTSGEVPPDVVFVPDTGDTEPVVQPGSGVTWDYNLAELVGLPKTEYEEKPAPHIDGGCAENLNGEVDIPSNDELQLSCALNTNGDGNDSLSDKPQPMCTLNATGEEAVFSIDELRPPSDLEPVDLVPNIVPEAMPAQNMEVPLEIVAAGVKTVDPSFMSLKKQSKKFAAPESSLRPLVGEKFGVSIGLKMRLLDMEAAMGVEALVPSKSAPARRRAWRSLVKSAQCIYEMTKAVIILEQMVRPDCLKRTWCHWSSLSSAARSATLSTLALRIFALDAAITYKKDKVIADELQRPSTLKKPKKKIQVQVPLSSKKKKANKTG